MGQSAYSSSQTYIKGQQCILDGVVYAAIVPVPTNTPPPNSDFWVVVPVPMPGFTAQILSLIFNDSLPFDVPCFAPQNFDPNAENAGSVQAILTTDGNGYLAGTPLQDINGNTVPIYANFPFSATIQISGNYIIAIGAWLPPLGILGQWWSDGSADYALTIPTGFQALNLSYNGVGPFPIPCWAVPSGWDGSGNATMGAMLTTGSELVSGLLDTDGNPIPDGYVFPAWIFVEESVIYDIVMMNAYAYPGGGLAWYGTSGGLPSVAINANEIFAPGIPDSDPAKAGALYVGAGNALFRSAG